MTIERKKVHHEVSGLLPLTKAPSKVRVVTFLTGCTALWSILLGVALMAYPETLMTVAAPEAIGGELILAGLVTAVNLVGWLRGKVIRHWWLGLGLTVAGVMSRVPIAIWRMLRGEIVSAQASTIVLYAVASSVLLVGMWVEVGVPRTRNGGR